MDCPADACVDELPTLPGDLIVVGTDGLWDNVFDSEVLQTVGVTLAAHQQRRFLDQDAHELFSGDAGCASGRAGLFRRLWRRKQQPKDRPVAPVQLRDAAVGVVLDEAALDDALRDLSQALVSKARKYALDRKRVSPFAEAARNVGKPFMGGYIFRPITMACLLFFGVERWTISR